MKGFKNFRGFLTFDFRNQILALFCQLCATPADKIQSFSLTRYVNYWPKSNWFCTTWQPILPNVKLGTEFKNQHLCSTFQLWEMVFCYQNCSDLLWEKIVLVIKKNFGNSRPQWDFLILIPMLILTRFLWYKKGWKW